MNELFPETGDGFYAGMMLKCLNSTYEFEIGLMVIRTSGYQVVGIRISGHQV
jgi:hypothetical protein